MEKAVRDAGSIAVAQTAVEWTWKHCASLGSPPNKAHALPGTPVLRYSAEIGMSEDLSLDGREAIRTPMQWQTLGRNWWAPRKRASSPCVRDSSNIGLLCRRR